MLAIFLDSETNGLNVAKHRIIELAYKIIDVCTGKVISQFETKIGLTKEQWEKSDPQSLQVNRFTWNELEHAPCVDLVSATVIHSFHEHDIQRGKAVFICQNPSFDRAFFSQVIDPDLQEKLNLPYHWLDLASMFWALKMKEGKEFPWDTGFTKDKIAKNLSLPSENQPHRAQNGVDHLISCYDKLLSFPQRESN